MLAKIVSIGNSAIYWLLLIILGVSMEAVALFYQHVLDEPPCVLCIHVRLWVVCFTLVALVALYARRFWASSLLAHALTAIIMVGLLERSWILLGTERGTIFGDCNFDLGLPSWLAFDQWLPAVFEVQTSCGYTPELLFGITMAEGLMVISVLLLSVTALLTVAILMSRKTWPA